MLRKLNDLTGFTIAATDDHIGSVEDFYFDDDTWSVRYVIVDTGPWILGRQVLISPVAVDAVDWEGTMLSVNLTKEQVQNSPEIGLDLPVSRQHEIDLHRYYGWPSYWYTAPVMSSPMGGMAVVPMPPEAMNGGANALEEDETLAAQANPPGDPHLRSVKDTLGYHIQATDDSIGHVEDFFADESDWRIRYMLVDTRNWLPGRKVLVALDWIDRIDWAERDVVVNVTREQVENSPEYEPRELVTRRYEEDLHTYYNYPGYWF